MLLNYLKKKKIGFNLINRINFNKEIPTILMIHGSGGSKKIWNMNFTLSQKFNFLAIDLPGHGETYGFGMDSVEDYAEWIGKIVKANLLYPIIMGHSLGGAIAQKMTLNIPELIRGLILVGTGCRLRVLPLILEGLLDDHFVTIELIIKHSYAKNVRLAFLREGVEDMKKCLKEVVSGDFRACNNFDICSFINRIKVPTQIIVGGEDRLTPPSYSFFLKEKIAKSKISVIENAGHMVMLEKSKEFYSVISKFLLDVF